MLQTEVSIGRKTVAGLKEVHDGGTLREQGVHHGGTLGNHRCLEEEREVAEHRVERRELGFFFGLVLNATEELGEDDQIEHDRSGQQRVLTDVVGGDGVLATHEDLGGVLVHGTLAVTDVREVLDHNAVIRMLSGLVEDRVRGDHVVDHVALRDLLGAELLRGGEVLAVVVAQMVVGHDGDRLETRGDQEIDQHRLHLGLARLEVVTGDRHLTLESQLDEARHEGVLGTAVDVRATLQHGSDGEQGGRAHLLVVVLHAGQQVVGGVVDAGDDITEALSVGGPEHHHLVQVVGRLEVADVLAQLLEQLLLGALQHVVGAILLVGSDEVREVDGRQRDDRLQEGHQLTLQIVLEHLAARHGVGHVLLADIPAAYHELVRVHHGEQLAERHEHGITLAVAAQLDGAGLSQRAPVVRLLHTLTGTPRQSLAVGNDTGQQGGAVVSTETHQHDTGLGNTALGAEGELSAGRGHDHTLSFALRHGTLVHILGGDELISVLNVRRFDNDRRFTTARHRA
mmetsp:Transcript_48962/g.123168  ORF Transcript_48962/g.123168 Transcript_48962/m.123168 type:complete len:512 (+) Transcript_48962:227-1762(+)